MRLAACLLLLLSAATAHAAELDTARKVLALVYDVGLYQSELDRAMAEAEGRGLYGGPGSTAVSRARDRALTRVSMLRRREAVLDAAGPQVAAATTEAQLQSLLAAARPGAAPPDPDAQGAVPAVKAGFESALWSQLAASARGNAEFPCAKDTRRC